MAEQLRTLTVADTRPYPETGMNRRHWATIEPIWVWWVDLTTTQRGVWIDALLYPGIPDSGDEYPHVVAFDGRHYLEDGHTRVVRAILTGMAGGYVRVYRSGDPVPVLG